MESTVPMTLGGKEFEDLLIPRLKHYTATRLGSFHRPGVHAATIMRFDDGTVRARLIQSLPDFQGVFGNPQREAVFDCKVCSAASFNLANYRLENKGPKARQLQHMYERDAFGSVCFFLLHWNARELKTKSSPSCTYAIPVSRTLPLWQMFESGELRTLTRNQCDDFGFLIPWTTIGRERTLRPDLMPFLTTMSASDRSLVED